MKKFILSLSMVFLMTPLFSQAFIVTAGYTSASLRFHDVEYFADSLLLKNGGVELEIPQKQRGFNAGFGISGMEGGGPYVRMGMNFTKHGQKGLALADGSSLRVRSTATDAYLCGGFALGGGAGGAFYFIGAATFATGRLDLNGNWNGLEGTYRGYQVKFSYGIGAGLVSETGFGLTLDLFCNFSTKDSKNFFKNGDKKIPSDYATYIANPTGYTGDYVRANQGYIRGQVTLHVPLGN